MPVDSERALMAQTTQVETDSPELSDCFPRYIPLETLLDMYLHYLPSQRCRRKSLPSPGRRAIAYHPQATLLIQEQTMCAFQTSRRRCERGGAQGWPVLGWGAKRGAGGVGAPTNRHLPDGPGPCRDMHTVMRWLMNCCARQPLGEGEVDDEKGERERGRGPTSYRSSATATHTPTTHPWQGEARWWRRVCVCAVWSVQRVVKQP